MCETVTETPGPVTLHAVEGAMFRGPSAPKYATSPVFCTNGAAWHPTLWATQRHHHPPLAWRRELLKADPDADTSWWTLSPICGLCHDHVHALLNMHVRAGAPPAWDVRRTFGVYVRDNVAEAWRRRPPVTPYT